jgi:hypothetical protein
MIYSPFIKGVNGFAAKFGNKVFSITVTNYSPPSLPREKASLHLHQRRLGGVATDDLFAIFHKAA